MPLEINDYVFDSTQFTDNAYTSTFPSSPRGAWPPKFIQDLVCVIGSVGSGCVGDTCYTSTMCKNMSCTHTFAQWKEATTRWNEYFELRMTQQCGIGVYTKKAFKKGDILGWYGGEVLPRSTTEDTSYTFEREIGDVEGYYSELDINAADNSNPAESVIIDASRMGSWTRFMNHSCRRSCTFDMARAGDVRITTIKAIEDIPANVELIIGYGSTYFRPGNGRTCLCGDDRCVSRSG
jgi:hypothetical protein